MAKVEQTETLNVSRDQLFKAITEFESYPKFVSGVEGVKVLTKDPSKVRIEYSLSIMGKEFKYVLDHFLNADGGEVRWDLISSDFFKKNSGSWKLTKKSDQSTEAVYSIDVEFKVMVPGFILNKLVKGNLPTLFKNFESRAKEISS